MGLGANEKVALVVGLLMDIELGLARILFREFLDGRQGLQKELGADFVEVNVNKEFGDVPKFLF